MLRLLEALGDWSSLHMTDSALGMAVDMLYGSVAPRKLRKTDTTAVSPPSTPFLSVRAVCFAFLYIISCAFARCDAEGPVEGFEIDSFGR